MADPVFSAPVGQSPSSLRGRDGRWLCGVPNKSYEIKLHSGEPVARYCSRHVSIEGGRCGVHGGPIDPAKHERYLLARSAEKARGLQDAKADIRLGAMLGLSPAEAGRLKRWLVRNDDLFVAPISQSGCKCN